MQSTSTSKQVHKGHMPDGEIVGLTEDSKIGFYGKTPVARRGNASQAVVAAVTDGSTGTAAATNGIAPLSGTYNSTLLINAIATLAAQGNALTVLCNEIRATLVENGMIKGSA
jgi:hypothetical protein